MSTPSHGTASPAQDYHAAYREKLEGTIRALTDAARLPRPRLRRTDEGAWVEDKAAAPEQMDWAEFVTLALAGAAANVGGIDAVLAGCPGSWEAAGVRQLLCSTVGADEAHLWPHRTDPIDITLYVEELLVDRGRAWSEYEHARHRELPAPYEAAEHPPIDYSRHAWEYHRAEAGDWVPSDPGAPGWSWETWRAYARGEDSPQDQAFIDAVEQSLRTGVGLFSGRPGDSTTAWIPKSPEDDAELRRLEAERQAGVDAVADLEDRQERQRLREWTAYGEALKTHILATVAATPGLDVPVRVVVDVDPFLPDAARRKGFGTSLESRLVAAAVMATPTPEDLPGTPLERLEQS